MDKENTKKKSDQVTMRLYEKDIDWFKKYSKRLKMSQKNLFHEMKDFFIKLRGDEENGNLITFSVYAQNDFNPEIFNKRLEQKIFAINGRYLGGIRESNEIKCGDDNVYHLSSYNPYYNQYYNMDYTREIIQTWSNAVNEEFGSNLDIDGTLHPRSIQVIPEFRCEIGLWMYWDIERKKYLLQDYFFLEKKEYQKDTNIPIVRKINTTRYRYILTTKELDEIFNNDRYLLFNVDNKKQFYHQLMDKTIIEPEELEEELEKYYIN